MQPLSPLGPGAGRPRQLVLNKRSSRHHSLKKFINCFHCTNHSPSLTYFLSFQTHCSEMVQSTRVVVAPGRAPTHAGLLTWPGRPASPASVPLRPALKRRPRDDRSDFTLWDRTGWPFEAIVALALAIDAGALLIALDRGRILARVKRSVTFSCQTSKCRLCPAIRTDALSTRVGVNDALAVSTLNTPHLNTARCSP